MITTSRLKLVFFTGFLIISTASIFTSSTAHVIGSDNSALIPQNADDFVGSESCRACHEDQFKSISATVHGKIKNSRLKENIQGCEDCHGSGKAHIEGGGDKTKIVSFKNLSAKEVSATCTTCHSQTSTHATWKGSKHELAGLSCLDCHSAHKSPSNKIQEIGLLANVQSETKLLKRRTESETCYQCHGDIRKSEFQRSTHLFKNEDRESRMSCSSCHDAHGSIGEKLMKSASINDTCYVCHTEKRGPFLWEHAPARESCANCHKAHGSNHTALLKARTPMLCQQCHIQGRHQTVAGRPNSAFMLNRSCTNCHSQVHGTNHPSGINLQR
jgi:DmsE family decaheme c-type cytochrome